MIFIYRSPGRTNGNTALVDGIGTLIDNDESMVCAFSFKVQVGQSDFPADGSHVYPPKLRFGLMLSVSIKKILQSETRR